MVFIFFFPRVRDRRPRLRRASALGRLPPAADCRPPPPQVVVNRRRRRRRDRRRRLPARYILSLHLAAHGCVVLLRPRSTSTAARPLTTGSRLCLRSSSPVRVAAKDHSRRLRRYPLSLSCVILSRMHARASASGSRRPVTASPS